jgi:catechol 2,3-dioxygenase-like lactoylglutathione lyase family enzyme
VRGIFSGMTFKRMDNVGVVVNDLAAAVAFFKELGLELEVRMVRHHGAGALTSPRPARER